MSMVATAESHVQRGKASLPLNCQQITQHFIFIAQRGQQKAHASLFDPSPRAPYLSIGISIYIIIAYIYYYIHTYIYLFIILIYLIQSIHLFGPRGRTKRPPNDRQHHSHIKRTAAVSNQSTNPREQSGKKERKRKQKRKRKQSESVGLTTPCPLQYTA